MVTSKQKKELVTEQTQASEIENDLFPVFAHMVYKAGSAPRLIYRRGWEDFSFAFAGIKTTSRYILTVSNSTVIVYNVSTGRAPIACDRRDMGKLSGTIQALI